jgi:hypothetical protein
MEGSNHHRNASPVLSQYVIGNITVSTTPTEIKVGADILAGRTRIYIINDSSNMMYLADRSTFTPGTTPTFISFSGETITIDLDPNPPDQIPERFWVATDEVTNTIRIAEVI